MKKYSAILAAVAAVVLAAIPASGGVLILNDGKSLEGTVGLATGTDANIVFTAPGKPAVSYKFSDVKMALFDGLAGGEGVATGSGVPWVRSEIGEVRRGTLAEIGTGTVTMRDEGLDPAEAKKAANQVINDNCCFVFQKLNWDGEILARINPGEAPGWARGGLMICEGLDGEGAMALVTRTSEGGAVFVRRNARGDEIINSGTSKTAGATWLKLTRSWDTVRALESVDGATWTPIGESRVEMDDKKGVYIGLAARGNAKGGIVFDSIKLGGRRSSAVVPGAADPRLRDVSVMLKDGTIISGMLESVDAKGEGKVKIADRGPKGERVTIKPGYLARAQFGPMTPAQMDTFLESNVGALTKDGDFMDGELRDVKGGSVTVSSVAFGLTTMEPGRVLGVVFQKPGKREAGLIEVHLQDGSLVMARQLSVEKDQLVIEEPLIGAFKTSLKNVISIDSRVH